MKVRASTNFDNVRAGDEVDLPPAYASGVIEKGLAVAVEDGDGADHQNKMEPPPEKKVTKPSVRKA